MLQKYRASVGVANTRSNRAARLPSSTYCRGPTGGIQQLRTWSLAAVVTYAVVDCKQLIAVLPGFPLCTRKRVAASGSDPVAAAAAGPEAFVIVQWSHGGYSVPSDTYDLVNYSRLGSYLADLTAMAASCSPGMVAAAGGWLQLIGRQLTSQQSYTFQSTTKQTLSGCSRCCCSACAMTQD